MVNIAGSLTRESAVTSDARVTSAITIIKAVQR